jgi:hypothetical protein
MITMELGERRRTAALASEAFVFAYPLVLMDLARMQLTASTAAGALGAPVNQFAHSREFPTAFTPVVQPNVDALYSSAWLDLSAGPIVLSVPNTRGRYFTMPIYDAWTHVCAAVGTRATGSDAADFAIVGPKWQGAVPADLRKIEAPTSTVWLLGRIRTDGPEDYPAVHAIQAGFRLAPLDAQSTAQSTAQGIPQQPPMSAEIAAPPRSSPVNRIARMDAPEFFGAAARLMAANPPRPADAPIVKRMGDIGVVAGRPLPWSRIDSSALSELNRGKAEGLTQIEAAGNALHTALHTPSRNNWLIPPDISQFGQDYLRRAVAAWVGLGASLPQDALSFLARADADGHLLTGARRYVLHFAPNAAPPVREFWSVTMYDDQRFFVRKGRTRYAIGDRDPLVWNADGSVDIHIQHTNPGLLRQANWLPTPANGFTLALRLYWPHQQALDGRWLPPAVTPVG